MFGDPTGKQNTEDCWKLGVALTRRGSCSDRIQNHETLLAHSRVDPVSRSRTRIVLAIQCVHAVSTAKHQTLAKFGAFTVLHRDTASYGV